MQIDKIIYLRTMFSALSRTSRRLHNVQTRMIERFGTSKGHDSYMLGCAFVGSTVSAYVMLIDIKTGYRRRFENPLNYIGCGMAVAGLTYVGAPLLIPVGMIAVLVTMMVVPTYAGFWFCDHTLNLFGTQK